MSLHLIALIAGIALLALVAIQLVMLLISSSSRLSAQRQQERLATQILEQRLAAARSLRTARDEASYSWSGWRKFTVARKILESRDVASIYLEPHDRKPLPKFNPGQYLTFNFKIPSRPAPVVRCYSLSDAPSSQRYRITVKRCTAPPGKDCPPGVASSHVVDELSEGDIIDVRAPSGAFCPDLTASTPMVLIAGGIGVTPMVSVLNAISAAGPIARETWFFYGLRNASEHVMKEHLASLAQAHDKLHLQVCYSAPAESDVPGQDYHHGGRVSVELFKKVLPSNNYDFYICGPPPMMESLVKGLEEWGVPESKVHFEAFGPASVKKVAPIEPLPAAEAATGIEVIFGRSGKKFQWVPAAGTLLDLADKNGISIAAGCRAGNCGTCITAVKSGTVKYMSKPGVDPERGSCLPCVGTPQGPVVLDA